MSVSHEVVVISQRPYQRLTRSCSHITMVTLASHMKCLSYHKGHTSVSHEGVLISQRPHQRLTRSVVISQRSHQRLTRRCSHITTATQVSHTKLFSYHKGQISVSQEGVRILQRSHQRLTRRCSHIIKVTAVSHKKLFSKHNGHSSL